MLEAEEQRHPHDGADRTKCVGGVLDDAPKEQLLVEPERQDRQAFKAASNVVVTEEQALAAICANQVLRAFKTAFVRIELRPTGPLTMDRGRNSCLLPQLNSSRRA
jgi:hypothetical protein